MCDNWKLILTFVESVVSAIQIGGRSSRVAVIKFANDASILWNLNGYLYTVFII